MTGPQYDRLRALAGVLTALRDDAEDGAIPVGIASWSDLHGHVDANDYLADADVPYGDQLPADPEDPAGVREVNWITDTVSAVLGTGLLADAIAFRQRDAARRAADQR